MSTLTINAGLLKIMDVRVNDVELTVELADGRTVSVPIMWYPRLAHSTSVERKNWEILQIQ